MSTATLESHQKELFGHPIGLFILFFTEMWERFSYYGMRAILVLYLVAETTAANPGMGWTSGEALALYGWYTMMVYVMSVPADTSQTSSWANENRSPSEGFCFSLATASWPSNI